MVAHRLKRPPPQETGSIPGIDIQIHDSQMPTKSAPKPGRGRIGPMAMPTAVYKFLAAGSRMYK